MKFSRIIIAVTILGALTLPLSAQGVKFKILHNFGATGASGRHQNRLSFGLKGIRIGSGYQHRLCNRREDQQSRGRAGRDWLVGCGVLVGFG